jgi:hypothetical protein
MKTYKHKQLTELTISFSSSETYSRPDRPLSFRVTTKDLENNEDRLDVNLPGVLHPSAAGLGEVIGVSESYEDYDQLLANSPHTQEQSIHLHTGEHGDEEENFVYYYNALASSVFQAIWDEIKLLCDEKGLIIESVELR